MTFSISALVLARDSHIKPDSEAGGLIPGTIWKISCHNLFITYFTLTFSKHFKCSRPEYSWKIARWTLNTNQSINQPSIDFYIAKKIFELTNYENKFLRELPLFNLQIFLFRIWFQKYTKQCRSVKGR
jgi:hypothetical protein